MDAFFFETTDNLRLFGVARGPEAADCAWILCPPFAEEEKSSRRLFSLIAAELAARGDASLVFSLRGTGDSEGDFAGATLTHWKADLAAAKTETMRRFPGAKVGFLGVRLGASLAWQQAETLGAARLILIEPLLSGRSFLMQQQAKKQIRAQMTGETAPDETAPREVAKNEAATVKTLSALFDDLDGWPLGAGLKAELSALDLKRETPVFSGRTAIFQVGPRAEIAPPLQALSSASGAEISAVVMPPFWNLIDAPDFAPLLEAIYAEVNHP